MKYRALPIYAFITFLLPTLICKAQTADPEPARDGAHKRHVNGEYPHGWKNLHPKHKKSNPFPNGRPRISAGAPVAALRATGIQPAQAPQPVAQTLPLWEYSVNANSTNYQGYIVGRNAFYNGHRSTTVQVYLVPVILTFPDGSVFDPTAADPCISNPADNVIDLVENSPLFQTTDFTFTDANSQNPVNVGTTQATDAFQRANFWTYVSPNANTQLPYHTLLTYSVLPAVSVSVPSGDGFTDPGSCPYGVMDYNWWDSYVENTLLPSLTAEGVGGSNVPIFLFDSVGMYLNGDEAQCCAFADHGSYNPTANTFQTYVVSTYSSANAVPELPDTAPLSHELGEWMNDPDNANPTPNWSNPADGSCDNTYEVGDAAVGDLYQISMPNGVTYNLQELVFYSWFYLQTPTIGAGISSTWPNGWYSDQGDFTTLPASCSNPSAAAGTTDGGR